MAVNLDLSVLSFYLTKKQGAQYKWLCLWDQFGELDISEERNIFLFSQRFFVLEQVKV